MSAPNDGGVAMDQKATVFAHDGGSTPITFSHVALVWSSGGDHSRPSTVPLPVLLTRLQPIPISLLTLLTVLELE